ncbi:MAG: hypothetical protein R3B07_12485 [Polyangiaceae bacterium]
MDRQSICDVEEHAQRFLEELQAELKAGDWLQVRRQYILKADGKKRPR